jgi:hypothetical protein
MRTPGFSAEASIYRSSNQYRAHGHHTPSEAGTIESAAYYTVIHNRGCIGSGTDREFHFDAIAWYAASVEDCMNTPGHLVGYPDICEETSAPFPQTHVAHWYEPDYLGICLPGEPCPPGYPLIFGEPPCHWCCPPGSSPGDWECLMPPPGC